MLITFKELKFSLVTVTNEQIKINLYKKYIY